MAAATLKEPQPRTSSRLCGELRLEIDGRDVVPGLPGGQATSLLSYLLASPDRVAARDELIAVLWPERPPRDPQGALRPILSRLRKAVAPAEELRERHVLRDQTPTATGKAILCRVADDAPTPRYRLDVAPAATLLARHLDGHGQFD